MPTTDPKTDAERLREMKDCFTGIRPMEQQYVFAAQLAGIADRVERLERIALAVNDPAFQEAVTERRDWLAERIADHERKVAYGLANRKLVYPDFVSICRADLEVMNEEHGPLAAFLAALKPQPEPTK